MDQLPYTFVCSNKLIRETELRFECQHETAHSAAMLNWHLAQLGKEEPSTAPCSVPAAGCCPGTILALGCCFVQHFQQVQCWCSLTVLLIVSKPHKRCLCSVRDRHKACTWWCQTLHSLFRRGPYSSELCQWEDLEMYKYTLPWRFFYCKWVSPTPLLSFHSTQDWVTDVRYSPLRVDSLRIKLR